MDEETFKRNVLKACECSSSDSLYDKIIKSTLHELRRNMNVSFDCDTEKHVLQVDRELFDAISGKLKSHKSKPINEFLR